MIELKKMTEERQNLISSRMRQLMGFRYFKSKREISKFEIAHSNLKIIDVITGQKNISVKEIEKEDYKKPKKVKNRIINKNKN